MRGGNIFIVRHFGPITRPSHNLGFGQWAESESLESSGCVPKDAVGFESLRTGILCMYNSFPMSLPTDDTREGRLLIRNAESSIIHVKV